MNILRMATISRKLKYYFSKPEFELELVLRRRHGLPPVRHLLHDLGGMVGQHQRGRGGEREQGGLDSEEVCWFKSIVLEILFVAKQAL